MTQIGVAEDYWSQFERTLELEAGVQPAKRGREFTHAPQSSRRVAKAPQKGHERELQSKFKRCGAAELSGLWQHSIHGHVSKENGNGYLFWTHEGGLDSFRVFCCASSFRVRLRLRHIGCGKYFSV